MSFVLLITAPKLFTFSGPAGPKAAQIQKGGWVNGDKVAPNEWRLAKAVQLKMKWNCLPRVHACCA